MPQNERSQNERSQNDDVPHGRFEEELGAILRSAGDGFEVDDRRELVAGGLQRGRRRLVRRRLAVTGGVLALAAVGVGGVYGGSLLGPAGRVTTASVAAPPQATGTEEPAKPLPFTVEIPLKDIAAVLQAHTPAGQWQFDGLEGTGQALAGVYDDGEGKAGVTVGLYRAGEGSEAGENQITCPDEVVVPVDGCSTGTLPGGDRFMIFQGYEYSDKRDGTKNWSAVLLTKDGFLIDVDEYNAPAEKGTEATRENPPFTPAQLKALIAADAWRPLLDQFPALPTGPGTGTGGSRPTTAPEQAAVQATLRSLLTQDLTITHTAGEGSHGYVVVDDGKGKSLVAVDVQPAAGEAVAGLFTGDGVVILPDGTKVTYAQQPGEKGGEGVVWWKVDTLSPEGFRVIVSAYNAGSLHEAATRPEPALSMEQLKELALSPKWKNLPLK
ncbi:hypothetical protein [Streptomyces sp. NPDC058872]|uniref:hypothetical protein n=1 Tax=Streptomyces sp. NPDC058872 TaxID=3346661 RepID=UPI00367BA3D6